MNKELYIRMNDGNCYTITIAPNEIDYTIEDVWDDIQSATDHDFSYFDLQAEDGVVIRTRDSVKLSRLLISSKSVSSMELYDVEDVPMFTSVYDKEPIENKGEQER